MKINRNKVISHRRQKEQAKKFFPFKGAETNKRLNIPKRNVNSKSNVLYLENQINFF